MYMQRVSIYPNRRISRRFEPCSSKRAKARQASGIRVAISEVVAGSNTPQFTVSTLVEDLAAFEALRKRDQADADFQKFVAKIGSLIRQPAGFDLMEVLVQMPS